VLKISIVDSSKKRRLVLEGALVPPWTAEVNTACERARADLDGRALVVDLKHVDAISDEGEDILMALMNDGVELRCEGVFTKHVLRQIACRIRRKL
jgi:hypothetical protein